MREVVVAGVGMTNFGKFFERSVRSLSQEAVFAALCDAGASPEDVEIVYFGNAASGLITGQEMIRGQAALRGTPLMGRAAIINVENACASGSTAFHLAWLAVASGQADLVLAVGAEKLTHPDKSVTFGAMAAGVDQEELRILQDRLASNDKGGSQSIFMDIYADKARKYMDDTGATDRDFAEIAVKSHAAASLNPLAQYRNKVTTEEVLASRTISPPITLLMCAPIGDGAAAVVLTTPERARQFGANSVKVRATVIGSGAGDSGLENGPERISTKAYKLAGIGPDEIDVVELHDATATAEMMLYESLSLCGQGEGVEFLRSGAPLLGGRVPVNPSGGLLSKGHPVGATGCAQIFELTMQLRGEAGKRQKVGAKVALAENGGGTIGDDVAVASAIILSV
jgi:acetyl-CoA acyltransferase